MPTDDALRWNARYQGLSANSPKSPHSTSALAAGDDLGAALGSIAGPAREWGQGNLLNRYRTHRAHLLVFLHRRNVPSDNHAGERALRPSVVHRKVIGSFRSD